MTQRRLTWNLAIVTLGVCAATPLVAQQSAPVDRLTPHAAAQIQALITEKLSRTPAQRKIDSQLIYARKMEHGEAIAAGVPSLNVALPRARDGRVELDLRANVSNALLAQLQGLGAEILDSDVATHDIRVLAPLDLTEPIALLPDVIAIRPKQQAYTSGTVGNAPGQMDWNAWNRLHRAQKKIRRNAVVAEVERGVQSLQPRVMSGPLASQGDATHKAANARATYGVDGTGVKVGVLSDGVASLASAQASGELGTVTVVPGQAGSGDEGTAMLEIIHDLAPGAQLFFATGLNGVTAFANNIRTLRTTYACDIIIDDIGYFTESPFQDGQTGSVVSTNNAGVVAQAVKDVVANGALYFSSAANSGNLDSGTSGTWEGDFVGTTPNASLCGSCQTHNFGGQNYDVVTSTGTGNHTISLDWSDPLGAASNDYDLYLTAGDNSTIISASTDYQSGSQDPHELLQASGSIQNAHIFIVLYSGSARFLHLDTNRDQLSIGKSGSTHGHPTTTAANSFSVAATPAVGPYPSPFSSSNVVEAFSSDGPRRIFFNGDGSAITAGNFSSTGGQLLLKPDLTAADGVSVSGVGGFGSPASSCGAATGTCFYGTSAAAPHAGAIAALVKSRNLAMTSTQVRAALLTGVVDIHSAGWDRDSGAGIIMADAAVGAATATPTITNQPANQTIAYNATATLTVTATGGTLTYQWYKGASGVTTDPITGATSNSYTTPAMISDRKFWVRVSNSNGDTNSSAALVTVNFTDPILTSGATLIKKVHWDEIAARITAEQVRGSVTPTTFRTLTSGVTTLLLSDYTSRRLAIIALWGVVFGGSPAFNSNPVVGSSISKTDMDDLRTFLHQLESR